jgi:hypothetical protein
MTSSKTFKEYKKKKTTLKFKNKQHYRTRNKNLRNSKQRRRRRKKEEIGGDKYSLNVKSLPKPHLKPIPPRK